MSRGLDPVIGVKVQGFREFGVQTLGLCVEVVFAEGPVKSRNSKAF